MSFVSLSQKLAKILEHWKPFGTLHIWNENRSFFIKNILHRFHEHVVLLKNYSEALEFVQAKVAEKPQRMKRSTLADYGLPELRPTPPRFVRKIFNYTSPSWEVVQRLIADLNELKHSVINEDVGAVLPWLKGENQTPRVTTKLSQPLFFFLNFSGVCRENIVTKTIQRFVLMNRKTL